MVKQPQPNPALKRWFYAALNRQRKTKRSRPEPFGTYYEFGVGWGGTLSNYLAALERFCNDFREDPKKFRIFGFDSFEGLPASENPADIRSGWEQGAMAHSQEEIEQKLKTNDFSKNFENIKFIKGFFEKSLTSSLRDELAGFPPGIVTVDVDFYSSTKIVLEWLRPILMSGTLFYFDDIWSFHGNPKYGQLKAINEFNEKNDGFLTPFLNIGVPDQSYIYSNKIYEY